MTGFQLVKYLITTLAIIFNGYIFSEVTLLVFNSFSAEENLGIIFLPFTLSIHSLIAVSFLGFMDFSRISNSKKYLYSAYLLGLMLLMGSIGISLGSFIIHIPYFIFVELIFWILLFAAIRYLNNQSLIPLIVNMLIICTGGVGLIILI